MTSVFIYYPLCSARIESIGQLRNKKFIHTERRGTYVFTVFYITGKGDLELREIVKTATFLVLIQCMQIHSARNMFFNPQKKFFQCTVCTRT